MSIETAWRTQAQQAVFRLLIEVTSRPGRIYDLAAARGDLPAVNSVLATLVDGAVSLHDHTQALGQREWSYLQARPAEAEAAHFILASGNASPDFTPRTGNLENPEIGATLILQVNSLGQGCVRIVCTGPGIEERHDLRIEGLNPEWLAARDRWNICFPLGVDLYLVDATRICSLPRTTSVTCES